MNCRNWSDFPFIYQFVSVGVIPGPSHTSVEFSPRVLYWIKGRRLARPIYNGNYNILLWSWFRRSTPLDCFAVLSRSKTPLLRHFVCWSNGKHVLVQNLVNWIDSLRREAVPEHDVPCTPPCLTVPECIWYLTWFHWPCSRLTNFISTEENKFSWTCFHRSTIFWPVFDSPVEILFCENKSGSYKRLGRRAYMQGSVKLRF